MRGFRFLRRVFFSNWRGRLLLMSKHTALAACFRARGYVNDACLSDESGQCLRFLDLPPLLRVLLLQDGTVTKTLEAFFWEPVSVRLCQQSVQAVPWGDSGAPESILHRAVSIQGQHSGILYCLADSLIRLDHLPEELAGGLLAGSIGIGELLRERGVETYRELESLFLASTTPGPSVGRCYLIHFHLQPVIRVTERFPLASYSL